MAEITKIFKAACIQLNSQNNLAENISVVTSLITEASNNGAEFITLPENAFFMAASKQESFDNSFTMDEHPAVTAMQALAGTLKCWLLINVIVKDGAISKLLNRSILIDRQGKISKYYDKIHLFDVEVKGDQIYRESENISAGGKAVLADIGSGKLGMTICYDLRFPQLFRALAKNGAKVITVPAAFTYRTGEAHWHSLLRARAIENTCYIIAPAQCGIHPRNRQTYGHSMIIDPWGKIIAEASEDKTGIIYGEINIDYVNEIRSSLPSLNHDRNFEIEE